MEKKKKITLRLKEWYERVTHKNDPHYISGKEARRIARENMRVTREYERKKKRKKKKRCLFGRAQTRNRRCEKDSWGT